MAEQQPPPQQGAEKKQRSAEASPPSVPTLAPMPLSEEEVLGLGPWFRPGSWVIADVRSGELETEPARSNLARTYILLGVAERLLPLVSEELERIRGMKDDMVSVSRLKAVAKMRVWYIEHSFHRHLRSHVDQFRREKDVMRQLLGLFHPRDIERETGGPTLHIMQELSSSGSASTSAPAAPPATAASGVHAPHAGECGDGTENVELEAGASTEEVAAGGAGVSEEATRSEWFPGRLEKKKAEGESSSSSGKSNDSLMSSASTLQEPSPSTSEAVVVDTLLASLQESQASAASDAMSTLQWVFRLMATVMWRHVKVAKSVLKHDQPRKRPVPGDDGKVEEQEQAPHTPQCQLVRDLELMHTQMESTKNYLSWSVASLQHVLDRLPPTPSALRLPPTPPTPPSASEEGQLSRFSQIFKNTFSRNK